MSFEVQGKRILVTGGTGLIGGHVAARLQARGALVRALARNPEKARALVSACGAEVVRGDMTDAASLRAAVDGCQGVVHHGRRPG